MRERLEPAYTVRDGIWEIIGALGAGFLHDIDPVYGNYEITLQDA